MFVLDVETRRMLAQDRIESLAASHQRRPAARVATLPVRALRARVAVVPPSTTAAHPRSSRA
jgi:hypothetical protein